MERREFLKILGLGGVALTLPKPLGIISAKMADLERPPLHVGYVETMPAKECGDGGYFLFYNIGVRTERGITVNRQMDYYEKWSIAMFLRKEGDRNSGVKYIKARACTIPNPEHTLQTFDEDGKWHKAPQFYSAPCPYLVKPDDVLEFWFVPANTRNPEEMPKYPLPKLEVVLCGTRHYAEPKAAVPKTGVEYVLNPKGAYLLNARKARIITYWNLCEVKNVLLDRAKAIELGLCDASEPKGIIA